MLLNALSSKRSENGASAMAASMSAPSPSATC